MSKLRLVLISGWAHPASALAGLAERLARSFDVSLTSTSELRPGSNGSYVRRLLSILKKGDGAPVVVGWSMGGMVALEAAAAEPSAIGALALISAGARFCVPKSEVRDLSSELSEDPPALLGWPRERARAMARSLRRDRAGTLRQFFLDCASPHDEYNLEEKLAAALAMDMQELIAGLNYLENFDIRSRLDSISSPALLIHGKADRIVPWRASSFLKARLRDSELLLHDDLGHALPEQKPDVLAYEILRFCEAR